MSSRSLARQVVVIVLLAIVAVCTGVAARAATAAHAGETGRSATGASSPVAMAHPLVVGRGEDDSLAPPPEPTAGCSVPADLADRTRRSLAGAGDLRAAVEVYDRQSGARYRAGDTGSEFGTASVVKVMIAARLLAEGEMSGDDEELATSMIERSDDDAANVLWSQTGADGLEPWVADHWGISDLGSPNGIAGRWGNTHVTADGLVDLYRALHDDPAVWPWLSRTMHAVDPVAADGTDQRFGLLAVDPAAAVKQGWADGSADDPADAVVNSTGFACGDRLVVVVLTEGHGNNGGDDDNGFNAAEADEVTGIVRTLLG